MSMRPSMFHAQAGRNHGATNRVAADDAGSEDGSATAAGGTGAMSSTGV